MNGTSEEVARRAYELFLARGAQHGSDMEDWLEAERQLTIAGPSASPGSVTPRPSRKAATRPRRSSR